MPTIQSIVYQPLDQKYAEGHISKYIRVPMEGVTLRADHGIEGDQKAGHSKTRQLNLIPTDWLAARAAEGYRTGPGQMGEQLIVDGITFDEMIPGLQLQLGDHAVVEITKSRTGCDRNDASQPRPLPEAIKLAGIGHLAKVIQGGEIRVGDLITVLIPEPA
jgi:MOSC domain-containing protein YiiM